MTGTDISATAVYAFRVAREGGIPVVYDEQRKVYSKILNFSFKVIDR